MPKVLEKYDLILAVVLGLIVILLIMGVFVKFHLFSKVRLYKVSSICILYNVFVKFLLFTKIWLYKVSSIYISTSLSSSAFSARSGSTR